MSTLQLCGICLLAVLMILLLRQARAEFAPLVSLAVSILLLGTAAAVYFPLREWMESLPLTGEMANSITAMTKCLGLALITQTTAEVCRDAGEGAIASRVELVGKAEILLLCLPMLKELIRITGEVLTW